MVVEVALQRGQHVLECRRKARFAPAKPGRLGAGADRLRWSRADPSAASPSSSRFSKSDSHPRQQIAMVRRIGQNVNKIRALPVCLPFDAAHESRRNWWKMPDGGGYLDDLQRLGIAGFYESYC